MKSGREGKGVLTMEGRRYYVLKNKDTGLWDICTDNTHNPPLERYRWAVDFDTGEEAETYLKETLTGTKDGRRIIEKLTPYEKAHLIYFYRIGMSVAVYKSFLPEISNLRLFKLISFKDPSNYKNSEIRIARITSFGRKIAEIVIRDIQIERKKRLEEKNE